MCAVGATARAASASGYSMQTTGSGYAEIDIPAPVLLDWRPVGNTSFAVTGDGAVAGLMLMQSSGTPGQRAIVTALRPGNDPCETKCNPGDGLVIATQGVERDPGGAVLLPAGQYRLYAITEPHLPVRVAVDWPGEGALLSLAPAVTVRAVAARGVRLTGGLGEQASRFATFGRLNSPGVVLRSLSVAYNGSLVDRLETCRYETDPGPDGFGPGCPGAAETATVEGPAPESSSYTTALNDTTLDLPAGTHALGGNVTAVAALSRPPWFLGAWIEFDGDPVAMPTATPAPGPRLLSLASRRARWSRGVKVTLAVRCRPAPPPASGACVSSVRAAGAQGAPVVVKATAGATKRVRVRLPARALRTLRDGRPATVWVILAGVPGTSKHNVTVRPAP